jgi:putative acetyltransferase
MTSVAPVLFADGDFFIRPIQVADNAVVAGIIRSVMPEFGAGGPGFSLHDAEVSTMCETYSQPRSAYFVVCRRAPDGSGADTVVGGGGVAALQGYPAEQGVCELRKMHFLKDGRGKGMGQLLVSHLIGVARELGFKTMYLETLNTMSAAIHVYEKLGFRQVCAQMGGTGHFSCDRFYTLEL